MSDPTYEWLQVLSKILLRCWLFGAAVLLFWFGAIHLAPKLTLSIHSAMFGIDMHELEIIHYCGMLLTKLVVGLFFFIPWVALRMVLRSSRP